MSEGRERSLVAREQFSLLEVGSLCDGLASLSGHYASPGDEKIIPMNALGNFACTSAGEGAC